MPDTQTPNTQTTRTELRSGWRFQDLPSPGASPTTKLPWLPAKVPGHVHLDLMRAGVIPDPNHRLHERAVAWVDETDWVYETAFHRDEPVTGAAYLVFHGLDTVAEVFLNGQPIGTADNMFIPHEFSVTELLKAGEGEAGENILRVQFASTLRVGRERHDAWDAEGQEIRPKEWFSWGPRSFVRKAQYMYGWDWGPELLGCGLWQRVELVTVPVARITNWKYDVEFGEGDSATVTVTADVERAPGAEDTPVEVEFELPDASVSSKVFANGRISSRTKETGCSPISVEVSDGSGTTQVSAKFFLETAHRWYPVGYGSQPLYSLKIKIKGERTGYSHSIGLRKIELLHEPDANGQGEGFKFRVNSVDVYAKGANWIPNSSFPHPGTYREMQERVLQASQAGFNMLRIWGGGVYESKAFYNVCDKLGILVWQDFPYACALYPDDAQYQEVARTEAVAAVRRVRNHASLALWCGNNENDTFYTQRTPDSPRYLGRAIYHEVLPAVVAAEDPATPYWPSSPYGGEDPNSAEFGDCHNWDVWHGRGDWVHYTENDSRFCSEFGFASSCGLGAWAKCLAPEDWHPQSAAVRWHDKTRKGYDTFWEFVKLHFPEAQTLEEWVYYSQCNQAEAMKYGVEHYRRRKGHCWGTLIWQINDCWPTLSWSMIDSEGEPKAAYFAAKRFYAPTLLSLVRDGDAVQAHLVNDALTPLSGRITLTLSTLDGETLSEQSADVSVDANAAAQAAVFSLSAAAGRERDVFVHARFASEDEEQAAENILLLAEPKDLRLSNPGLSVAVGSADRLGVYAITVTAARFAPYVWLRRSDHARLEGLSDNFFHLRPGETRTVTVERGEMENAEALQGRLLVQTL